MEDEDVDSVNKLNDPAVNKSKIDDPITLNDAKDVVSPENNGDSVSDKEYETEKLCSDSIDKNVDRLKNCVVNHENTELDKFKVNEDSVELTSPSLKKVNGDVDKNESVTSSEEESFENEKTSANGNVEESKSCEDVGKETVNDTSEGSNKRKHSISDHSELADSENESDIDSANSSPIEFRGFKKIKTLNDTEKIIGVPEVNSEIESSNEIDKFKSIELRRSSRCVRKNSEAVVTVEPKEESEETRNVSCVRKNSEAAVTVEPKEESGETRNVSCVRKNNDGVVTVETKEESGDQLTEYAQYLGLQPTVKFKCGRCGEKHFQSMASLNTHQMICCKPGSNALVRQAKPSNDLNPSTNFRITRKVYLCSACGTYYENWKLFLHMRDMHKRHICLFCLGMFSVAERLAEHLLYQHNVHEKTCKSPEEFLNLFKGSCFLTCCSCEKMFTERDDFYDHQCKDPVINVPNWNNEATVLTAKDIKELAQKCTLCGVKCGHFRTCPKVAHKFQQNTPSSSVASSTNTPNSNSPNINLDKYYLPVPTKVQNTWTPDNGNPEILKQALSLSQSEKDYYDVGSAASFCHVDIVNDSDSVSSPEKAVVEKTNLGRKKFPKYAHKSATPSEDIPGSNTDERSDDERSSCKSFTNASNNIKNSFSDDNDYSDGRPDSNDDRISDNEPAQKRSQEEDSGKSIVDDDVDDRMSIDDDRVSTEGGNVNAPSTPDEETVNRLEDKPDLNENEDQGNPTSPETKEETTETDTGRNNETLDRKLNSEVGNLPCSVNLSKLNEKEIVNSSNESKREDPVVLNCNSNSSMSDTNSSSRNSSRSDGDTDHDNEQESSKIEEVKETPEDTDKTETTNINEEPPKTEIDDKSSSYELKLSPLTNEESCDNRFENNINKDKASEDNESEDSDKLSVDLSDKDEDNKETSDDDDVDTNEVPTDESVKDENLDDTSEIDTASQQHNENSKSNLSLENNSEDDVTMEESQPVLPPKEKTFQCDGVNIQLASEEVMAMALTLEDKMDSLSSQSLVKECVRTSCTTCSYCSHAIKIAVNGKQLAVHLLTEHRYMPVKNETVDDIIERLKNSLDELQDVWFNTDSYDSSDKSCFVNYDHTYECFQCNYVANTHKDLFSHKRKVHQKTILYCNMCKENFYSYSELLCHMCPGLYDAAKDIQFRCCLCTSDRIPSAFRLMVHLRKSHHACDICLEIIDDQQKLSTHMVKHKLHHLCYRCGIAYRNKPDITKHLFWKHGTESVLCKKCLQKKWPHVYHFCVPPSLFICEECNLSFSKAVYLKVHKRFHNNNLPYPCSLCEQKFVSKKLLSKHEKTHEPVATQVDLNIDASVVKTAAENDKNVEQNKTESYDVSLPQESAGAVQRTGTPDKSEVPLTKPHKKKSKRDKEKKVMPVVDVYDLPPLNLSSESDDTEDEKENRSAPEKSVEKEKECLPLSTPESDLETPMTNDTQVENAVESEAKSSELAPPENEETAQPVTVVDGIWDSFHSYKAEQEKRENLDIAKKQTILSQLDPTLPPIVSKESVLGDHDYCLPNNDGEPGQLTGTDSVTDTTKPNEHSSSIDHDYCTQKTDTVENNNVNTSTGLLNSSNQSDNTETPSKRKQKSPKKKTLKQNHNSSSSSDSSTDSETSSCSCGTNCSCSSSSSNSSSSSSSDSDSSSSDGRNNSSNLTASTKRERKKERSKNKRKNEPVKQDAPLPPVQEPVVNIPIEPEEPLIRESELDTDETITDEEFYDQYPQMRANQILAEKRNQLMVLAAVAPTVNNGSVSPPVPNSTNNTNINLDPVSSPKLEIVTPPVTPVVQPQTQSKKKVKSKKRRKSSLGKIRSNKQQNLVNDLPQPSTSFSSQWSSQGKKTGHDIPPTYMQSPAQQTVAPMTGIDSSENMSSTPVSGRQQFYSTGSESNSSKRFSKRRRVRNKFYGYSSDEDGEHHQSQPPVKWKKFSSVEGGAKHNSVHQQPQPPQYPQSFQPQVNPNLHPEYNHSYHQHTPAAPPPLKVVPPTTIRTTFSENQVSDCLIVKKPALPSSESCSDSEVDSDDSDSNRLTINQKINPAGVLAAGLNIGASEKDDKLYCYCQCPYDEVSEMIACDGIDCAIEWFHFECVGIMVPPKGKWYCPDCRKRRGLS